MRCIARLTCLICSSESDKQIIALLIQAELVGGQSIGRIDLCQKLEK